MDNEMIRGNLIHLCSKEGLRPEEAEQRFLGQMGKFGTDPEFRDTVASVRRRIQEEAMASRIMKRARYAADPYYQSEVETEVREASWCAARSERDEYWPHLIDHWRGTGLEEVTPHIDGESMAITSFLANPGVHELSKRGLVLGHVQSGKTANYTGVLATAADRGYRLFIVLSGMHNGLRRQTQRRLEEHMLHKDWVLLTSHDADFGHVVGGNGLFGDQQRPVIAIVKKNARRLERLNAWLAKVPLDIRTATPALIIDDEADQATPNTLLAKERHSTINALVRDLRSALPTGSYVGYTATPFANIFMDPDDEKDLYPADFIFSLERSDSYFGAEQLFGRPPLSPDDEPDDGLDMIREIPATEAGDLRAPSNAEQRASWSAPLPASLQDAIDWFVIATAARRARGQDDHSSMMIHTSHYTDAHFAQRSRVDEALEGLRGTGLPSLLDRLKLTWIREQQAVSPEPMDVVRTPWEDVSQHIAGVVDDVRTVVDNALSEDRLDYTGKPQVVIAVGGNTLSRGLTLEGLVVSYFVRSSNTYDTLLQMGRWFGYRPGYEDLPRIWTTEQLESDFRFLAGVEHEIREDIERYEREGLTPRQLGLRIRNHPGRLAVTARSKMHLARPTRVGYAGTRRQTFIFEERDRSVLQTNIDAVEALVAGLAPSSFDEIDRGQLARDVDTDVLVRFLRSYRFHEDHADLTGELVAGWIDARLKAGKVESWNVALMSSSRREHVIGDRTIDMKTLELPGDISLACFSRAPLRRYAPPKANIGGLMSRQDRLVDLDVALPAPDSRGRVDETVYEKLRMEHAADVGLLLVYPISEHSEPKPLPASSNSTPRRRPLEAPMHIVGLGLVFPSEGAEVDGTYLAVPTSSSAAEVVEEFEEPSDIEGEYTVAVEPRS